MRTESLSSVSNTRYLGDAVAHFRTTLNHAQPRFTDAFDWDAYMEQVYRFLPRDTTHTHPSTLDPPHGAELRYSKLYGDTGALVYPAAHVYIHSALLLATRWNPVLWTTEYTPKLIAGYERRIERPTGTIAAIQAAYLALYFVLLCELWAVLESAWKVCGGVAY